MMVFDTYVASRFEPPSLALLYSKREVGFYMSFLLNQMNYVKKQKIYTVTLLLIIKRSGK